MPTLQPRHPAPLPAGLSREGKAQCSALAGGGAGRGGCSQGVVALVPCPRLGARAWGVARTQR